MLTAAKCRAYATESERLGTHFESIMALKWRSLANGLDCSDDNLAMPDANLISRINCARRFAHGFQIRNR
jgi:hypothetical protein